MINKNAQNCVGQRTQPKRVIMNPPLFPTTLPKITRTIKSLIAIIYHKLNKRINYDINRRPYSLWRLLQPMFQPWLNSHPQANCFKQLVNKV